MKIQEIINTVISIPNAAFFYTPPIYGNRDSYLFIQPKEIVTIKSLRNLDVKLTQIDNLIEKGYFGYSLLNYESGYLFEKTLNKLLPKNERLIQFFFYDQKSVQRIKSSEIDFEKSKSYNIKNFRLDTTKNGFIKSISKIKSYIEEGDTYQVNYTVKGTFNFDGSYSGLFSNLIFNQSAKYIALINNYNNIIFSISPELFFEINRRKIISRPMKGTSRRGTDLSSDSLIKYQLETSKKNIAENVMIVDLLRNDLGKISKYGSVKVKNLFQVEKYESVYQMVSTIESKLGKKIQLSDVLRNIFPCGSITGAPKIRTMEIIKELEKKERGIYTGAIGLIRKDKVTFSVPIRTLCIDKKSGKGEIGLGSGIVWDSFAGEEYQETLLKGKFLTDPEKPFKIFETILVNDNKLFLLEEHLDRMQQAAEYFLFCFDRAKIKSQIEKVIKSADNEKFRFRISLSKSGKLTYKITPIKDIEEKINVIISRKRIDSKNKFQYFKTTNRYLYDREHRKYSSKGFFDVIYFNEHGELAEGAITNIFVYKTDVISTPPLNVGILSGVYRKYMIKNNTSIKERRLHIEDLLEADKIVLTNSVRGEVVVSKLFVDENEFIDY